MNYLVPPTHGSGARSRCPQPACVRPFIFVLITASLLAPRIVWSAGYADADNSDQIANSPVTFSVMGDVPYGSSEVPEFQQQIDQHDLYSPSELIVHVGDIKSGSESCAEDRYRTVRDIMRSSIVPGYIVPGDNETTDCSNPSQGWQYWTQYLLGLDSYWSCSPSTSRQSGRQENFVFVHEGILFLGINLVGGTNSSAIMEDDAAWVSQHLQEQVSQVRGAVIFAQAGPGGSRDAFFGPFDSAAQLFAKPILYIHGDGHSWILDKPFAADNVTRVQVEQGGNELPVQVTATLDASNMFQFVRNPWNSNSQPVNRPPCGGSATPSLAISDASIDEGNTSSVTAAFTVTLSNPNGQTVSVQYATANGSAQSGSDYTTTSGSLSFSGSTTSRTISVPVLGDMSDEPDENFFVDLTNASNATLADSRGQGTIRDDDSAGTPTTLVFNPVADAYVRTGSTSNYGSATELRVKTSSTTYKSYFKFTLSGVGAFDAAKLRLYVLDATSIAGTVHAVSNDYAGTTTSWVENGIHGNNAPAITAPALGSLGSTSNGTWIEFDVTPAITGDGTYSFALQSTSSNSGRYGSKESTNKPQLVLQLPAGPGPGNTAPVAVDDSRMVAEDGTLAVEAPGLLANDSDADGHPLTAQVTVQPTRGTLSLQSSGAFTYAPQAKFHGTDPFTYRASDGNGGSDTAVVTITVTPAPDAPVAATESYSVQADATLTVAVPGVLGNDSDADGDGLSTVLQNDVDHGTLSLQSNGAFTYTPVAGWSGTDGFTYRASDGNLQSAETTVTLNVGSTASGIVTFVEVQTGASSAAASVAITAAPSAAAGDLFLASIATKPLRAVTGVTGLGLGWTRLRAQCAGRGQTGIEIWMARGTTGSGSVTATLASSAENAVIAVSRYSGAHATTPIGNIVSGNGNGVDGSCSNGIDGPAYALSLTTQSGSLVLGGVAMRARTNTPGSGWTERAELRQGSGGGIAGLAVADRNAASSSTLFDGSFESTVDWAAIAVEVRSAAPTKAGLVAEVDVATPFAFGRAHPNPVTQSTSVVFDLPNSVPVEVSIFNARGQRVRTLLRGVQPAGRHRLQWDIHDDRGSRVPAGVYFLRARLGARIWKQKVVVQR